MLSILPPVFLAGKSGNALGLVASDARKIVTDYSRTREPVDYRRCLIVDFVH